MKKERITVEKISKTVYAYVGDKACIICNEIEENSGNIIFKQDGLTIAIFRKQFYEIV